MWTTEHAATTTATPEDVWAALTALHSGTPLGPESDSFVPHGPLAVGTILTVTPHGQGPMESTITEFEPGRVYADLTEVEGLRLTFRHRIEPIDGGTRVTHVLEIDGPAADAVAPGLGPQISGDFPAAMAELLGAAERMRAAV